HLCNFHHTLVHEGGYEVRKTGPTEFTFVGPTGRRIEAAPPAPDHAMLSEPLESLAVHHSEAGLDIAELSLFPDWDGLPPDYPSIIDALISVTPTLFRKPKHTAA